MRPYPEEVMRILQTGMGAHFMPELQSSYAKAQFMFAALLFTVVQRDFDSSAADLVENNRSLRTLLEDARVALPAVDSSAAKDALAALALPEQAGSIKLSDLRREYDALREALVRLVPLIEPAGDDDSLAALRSLRTAVYAYLQADAKKRVVPILSA